MITTEIKPMQFVRFFLSKFSDEKKFAQVKQQRIVWDEPDEEEGYMPESSRKEIDNKFRWTFTPVLVDTTEEEFIAQMEEVPGHIVTVRGCILDSVLAVRQRSMLAKLKKEDPETAEARETSWVNKYLLKDGETGEVFTFGDLKLESYGRKYVITDPDKFHDVDFRQSDYDQVEALLAAETEPDTVVEEAPVMDEADELGAE